MSDHTTPKTNLPSDNKIPTNKSDPENRKRRSDNCIANQDFVSYKVPKQDDNKDEEDCDSVFGYSDEEICVPELFDDYCPEPFDNLNICSVENYSRDGAGIVRSYTCCHNPDEYKKYTSDDKSLEYTKECATQRE